MTSDDDINAASAQRTAKHMCPLCEAACGLDVHLSGVEVTLIRGDRDDVFSGGYVCPKGTALKGLQTDPDRLTRPLVRRDDELVEVSFAEAFAEVERLLRPIRDTHGPSSCGLVIGNPTVHRTGLVLYALDLAASLGSPNVFSSASLDQMPKHLSVGEMFGDFYTMPVPDISRTDLLVIIGANPLVSNGSMWSVPDYRGKAKALRARGGRIITIDPRRTETAEAGDRHYFIRPGTDALLLAAIARTLFAEGLVDLGPLEDHVVGVDAVASAVTPFDPDVVGPACGIDAEEIRDLARTLARAPSAAVYGRLGTCLQEFGTVTSWLIDVINVLTGNLDRPGGAMFPKAPAFAANTNGAPGSGAGIVTGAYASRVSGAPEVMGQLPMACLAEEIETPGDGQIKALIMMASNAALSSPDGPRTERALQSLDALICLDVYVNETTRHADVIIPGPSPLEESHYDVFFSQFAHHNVARYSPPAVDRDPEVPLDWETMVRLISIVRGLGAETDVDVLDDVLMRELLDDAAPEFAEGIMAALGEQVGVDRRLDSALRAGPYGDMFGMNPGGVSLAALEAAPSGIDLGPLEPRIPEVLRTPSGRIELAPASFVDELGRAMTLLGAERPACVLIGRRHLRSNNSWMHNVTTLIKGRDRCTLIVHPDDANEWGLTDGADAEVSANGQAIVVRVTVSDEIMPGVVSLPHGWGHDGDDTRLSVAETSPGVNINVLTVADRRDRLSGNAALSGVAVTVGPASG